MPSTSSTPSPASSSPSVPSPMDAALRRYLVRSMGCMAVYVLLNLGAIFGAFDAWIGTGAGWLLALAAALPLAGQIWALWRLIADSDEYLRALWTQRALLSAGLTLVVCCVWGFGQTYANAPLLPAWLVYPLFWALSGAVWPLVRSTR